MWIFLQKLLRFLLYLSLFCDIALSLTEKIISGESCWSCGKTWKWVDAAVQQRHCGKEWTLQWIASGTLEKSALQCILSGALKKSTLCCLFSGTLEKSTLVHCNGLQVVHWKSTLQWFARVLGKLGPWQIGPRTIFVANWALADWAPANWAPADWAPAN